MLVQYGGGILDARGSIGGQTHSRNRYGPYVKARTTPVNPKTNRQNVIRAAVAALSQRWSTVLTQAQRNAWEVYALAITRQNKLGAQIKLTGFNHYLRSNTGRVQTTLAAIDPAPVLLNLPAQDPTFDAVISEATQTVSVSFDDALPWCTQNAGIMMLYMSAPKATGTNYIDGPYRYFGAIVGVDPAGIASPQGFPIPWVCAEGQVGKVRARICEEDARLSDHFHRIRNVAA